MPHCVHFGTIMPLYGHLRKHAHRSNHLSTQPSSWVMHQFDIICRQIWLKNNAWQIETFVYIKSLQQPMPPNLSVKLLKIRKYAWFKKTFVINYLWFPHSSLLVHIIWHRTWSKSDSVITLLVSSKYSMCGTQRPIARLYPMCLYRDTPDHKCRSTDL